MREILRKKFWEELKRLEFRWGLRKLLGAKNEAWVTDGTIGLNIEERGSDWAPMWLRMWETRKEANNRIEGQWRERKACSAFLVSCESERRSIFPNQVIIDWRERSFLSKFYVLNISVQSILQSNDISINFDDDWDILTPNYVILHLISLNFMSNCVFDYEIFISWSTDGKKMK